MTMSMPPIEQTGADTVGSAVVLTWQIGLIGGQQLRVMSVNGSERMNEPFQYVLDLRSAGPDDPPGPPLKNVVGASVVLGINRPSSTVYYHGIVTTFRQVGLTEFEAVMRPQFWKLTLSSRYYIYKDMTIPDVINQVLGTFHKIDFRTSFTNPLTSWERHDWLQSGDSDFIFLSRLFNKVGIFYFFVHEPQSGSCRDVLVLADNVGAYQTAIDPATKSSQKLTVQYSLDESRPTDALLLDYSYEEQLTSRTIGTTVGVINQVGIDRRPSGAVSLPDNNLYNSGLNLNRYLQYDEQVTVDTAKAYNTRAIQGVEVAESTYSGRSTCRVLHPGYKFTAVNNHRSDLDGEYLVYAVEFQADAEGLYVNNFQATPPQQPYWTEEMATMDVFPGPLVGTVVSGPRGKEPTWKEDVCTKGIFPTTPYDFATDPHTSYKMWPVGIYVEFPWDPGNSHWIRLSPGMETAPEIGSLVMVATATGNSDIPEIVNIIWSHGTIVVREDNTLPHTFVGNSSNWSIGNSYSAMDGDSTSRQCGWSQSVMVGDQMSVHFSTQSGQAPSKLNSTIKTAESYSNIHGGSYGVVSYSYTNAWSYNSGDNDSQSYGNMTSFHGGNSVNVFASTASGKTQSYDSLIKTAKGKSNIQGGGWDQVNFSYGNSYSYTENVGKASYNEFHGDQESKHYGNNTNYQSGNNDSTQDGDNTNMQTGSSKSTHIGSASNIHIGTAFSLQVSASISINVGASLNINVAASLNISLDVSIAIHIGFSLQMAMSISISMHLAAAFNITLGIAIDLFGGIKIGNTAGGDIEVQPMKLVL